MKFAFFFEHFNLVVFYAFSIFGYGISVFLIAFHVPVVITIKIERRDAELSTEIFLNSVEHFTANTLSLIAASYKHGVYITPVINYITRCNAFPVQSDKCKTRIQIMKESVDALLSISVFDTIEKSLAGNHIIIVFLFHCLMI